MSHAAAPDPDSPSTLRLRRFPLSALIGACALLIAAAGPACMQRAPSGRPNVLMIVMDTTRADRCSINGYDRETTPELEAFAEDAVVFADAWSPSLWTAPSHASVFTGLRPPTHGLMNSGLDWVSPEIPTLAERLAQDGYETAAWSNNPVLAAYGGLLRGFTRIERVHDRDELPPHPRSRATHAEAGEWALSRHAQDKPFFLFINNIEPHSPYAPSPATAKQFTRGRPLPSVIDRARAVDFEESAGYSVGELELAPAFIDVLSDLYDAEIRDLDREIGVLLKRLDAAGVLDNTLVVIMGDHGENLGEHHLLGHALSLHRTLLHVPLVVRYPGRYDGGETEDAVVRLEDITPTVLDVCGIPIPEEFEGHRLDRSVEGRIARAGDGSPERWLRVLHRLHPGLNLTRLRTALRSVYDGRYHLIENENGQRLLYDVQTDPLETRDVAQELPAEVTRLRQELDDF